MHGPLCQFPATETLMSQWPFAENFPFLCQNQMPFQGNIFPNSRFATFQSQISFLQILSRFRRLDQSLHGFGAHETGSKWNEHEGLIGKKKKVWSRPITWKKVRDMYPRRVWYTNGRQWNDEGSCSVRRIAMRSNTFRSTEGALLFHQPLLLLNMKECGQ